MKRVRKHALSRKDQLKWLQDHIPERLRAAVPGLRKMKAPWDIAFNRPATIEGRCHGDSIWEGRLTAIRWLIFFVGIVPPSRIKDVWIEHFRGGKGQAIKPWSVRGRKLKSIWLGCSKATGHPTQGTRHPKVNEEQLCEALTIIVDHLQATITAVRNTG